MSGFFQLLTRISTTHLEQEQKNMLDKKRQEKMKSVPELGRVVTEILIANGRDIEPFIKVFNYSNENIEKSSLGSLIGVFEIDEKGEDSTYIVNFLTSVAKKEYFSNSRRGSIESFEATLHKINLALAELVKDGNIAWLGKFHGALGVLEKNNLHFSVTGKAQILLLRNGNFSEISEGIASPESNTHPIKTFVEISSGRLIAGDKVILTSPELFDLLSLEDLKKSALRMDIARFAQFLRTVLVNELNMGGSLVIDFSETPPVIIQKEPKKHTKTTRNVFSQETFESQREVDQPRENLLEDKTVNTTKEYIDSKTGHIYVQGDTNEKGPENPLFERTKLSLQDTLHTIGSLLLSQRKILRKGKKQGYILFNILSEKSIVITRKTTRFLRKQIRKGISLGVSKISAIRFPQISKKVRKELLPELKTTPEHHDQEETQKSAPVHRKMMEEISITFKEESFQNTPEEDLQINTAADVDLPLFMKEKLATFYQKNETSSVKPSADHFQTNNTQKKIFNIFSLIQRVQKIFQRILFSLHTLWKNISPKIRTVFEKIFFSSKRLLTRYQNRTLILGFFSVIILVGGIFLITQSFLKEVPSLPVAEIQEVPILVPKFPIDTEKNARLVEENATVVATIPDVIITSVILNDATYIITASYLYSLNEQKQYSLPIGNGTIKFAAPMDDLNLIFIYTNKDEILSFAPANHTFTKNALTLPSNALVKDIGTYLTYLYVLDKTTSQVYRFPRAEGGFGVGTPWLKKTFVLEDTAQMAINETIFIAPSKTTISAFFRGQFVKNLESPITPISLTNLFTHPGLTHVYALDTDNKRILIWDQDGALLVQYFSDQFADAKNITTNEKTNEIFFTNSNNLLSFKFNLGQ